MDANIYARLMAGEKLEDIFSAEIKAAKEAHSKKSVINKYETARKKYLDSIWKTFDEIAKSIPTGEKLNAMSEKEISHMVDALDFVNGFIDKNPPKAYFPESFAKIKVDNLDDMNSIIKQYINV